MFASAWCVENVANDSEAFGLSTEFGAAAGMGSVAGLAMFFGRDKKFRFLGYLGDWYLAPQRILRWILGTPRLRPNSKAPVSLHAPLGTGLPRPWPEPHFTFRRRSVTSETITADAG